MKKLTYFLLLLLLPFTLFAQVWKTFSDPTIEFTAKYPPTWTNKIKENKRVFFTSPAENAGDNFFENVNISVIANEAFGTSLKIKDALPDVINGLKGTITDFKLETQRYFKWNNTDACEITYTGYFPGSENIFIRITQWLCFSRGRLFTATYTSMADNSSMRPLAIRILNSVVFK